MTWTRIPDDWIEQVEAAGLSKEAERLHIRALVYANKTGTNGEINEAGLRRISLGMRNVSGVVQELCDKFGWKCNTKQPNCVAYLVPWDDQESAQVVQRRKALGAARNRRYRERSLEIKEERDASRDAQSDAVTNATPARTVPSRPNKGKGKGKDKKSQNPSPSAPPGAGSTPEPVSVDGTDIPKLGEEF
ncbi:hypothetical protein [Rhodococcus opacus]|uniref:hypothetical protein n=1 Tax=Rhodococcus opacus TaxID=37919 RepID=UPI00155A1136|nr:hypothetical protein [Rhodococcus opacus]